MTKKGPALKAPKAKIFAVLKEAEADAAAVEGALKPGAEVRSADGAADIEAEFAAAPAEHQFKLGVAFERSEEHTSELQSLMRISYAVFCLKKKKHTTTTKL